MEGGYKPTQKNINEVQKIIGEDKLEFNSAFNDPNDGTYTISGTVDGKDVTYNFNDPYSEYTLQDEGFTTGMIDLKGSDIKITHPKNKEILEYLKKNN